MASTSSNSWIPTSGQFEVQIGASLGRALKARRNAPPPKNNKLPDRDFYSFRYNFIPESVDATKAGVVEVKKGKETTNVNVERASSQSSEGAHLFAGTETPARDVDCALVYDPETVSWTVEKLDSFVALTYDRKINRAPKHPGSPHPVSRPTPSTSSSSTNVPLAQNHARRQALDAADQIEAEFGIGDEDAPGDPDDEFEPFVADNPPRKLAPAKKEAVAKSKATLKSKVRAAPPAKPMAEKEEEEESEGEIIETPRIAPALAHPPPATPAPPKARQKPAPRISQSVAPTPPISKEKPVHKPTPPAPATHPLPPKPAASAPILKNSKKHELPTEQTFEISRTAKPSPPKRARRSPSPSRVPSKPVEEEFSLALPGGLGISLPSAPAVLPHAPAKPAPAPAPAVDESDDDEWDDVVPAAAATTTTTTTTTAPPPPLPPSPVHRIVMEEIEPEPTVYPVQEDQEMSEEEEIDENAFTELINQHLEEDEGLEPAMSPVSESRPAGVPMSLNRYAGGDDGENIWGDDDDDSTSDDSDDD